MTVMSRTMGRGRGEAGARAERGLMLTITGILEPTRALLWDSEAEDCLGGSGGSGGGGVNVIGTLVTGGAGILVLGDSSFFKIPKVSSFKFKRCLFSFLPRITSLCFDF